MRRDLGPAVAELGEPGDQACDVRLAQVGGERLLVAPLLDRDEAERIADLGVVAVVEAAVVLAGRGLDLLEQCDEIVAALWAGPEACDDDHHGASIALARTAGN